MDRVLGIDLSHWDQAVDWEKAKAGGVLWMYAKASQGDNFIDHTLKMHTDGAKAQGVLTAAYHFFMANCDPEDQADIFLRAIKGMSFDLPHILDWEEGSVQGRTPKEQIAKAQVWLDRIEESSGRVPWIYMGNGLALEDHLPASFARYPLIDARYGVSGVNPPPPWSKVTAWQFSESAAGIAGIRPGKTVDANWFFGDAEDLMALAVKK